MADFMDPPHRVRVRYCETDRMAVAHHGSYVAWFEEARTEWMRRLGKSYREISQSVGMAENTIGPTLSRARAKMRRAGADATT